MAMSIDTGMRAALLEVVGFAAIETWTLSGTKSSACRLRPWQLFLDFVDLVSFSTSPQVELKIRDPQIVLESSALKGVPVPHDTLSIRCG